MSRLPTHYVDKAITTREIEIAFLSEIILDIKKFSYANSEMNEDYFYWPDTKFCFQVAREIFGIHGDVNVVSVQSEIFERGKISEASPCLMQLGESSVSPDVLRDYTMRIFGAYDVREFTGALRDAEERVMAKNLSILQRQAEIHKAVERLMALTTKSESTFMNARQFAMYAAESFAKSESGQVQQKQKTGIMSFDRYIGGLVPGRVSIVGGLTSHGKTSFATYLTISQCKKWKSQGVKGQVLYFSAEMSHNEMSHRFLSSLTGVSAEKIGQGSCNDHESIKVKQALEEMLLDIRVSVDTNPAPTTEYMMSKAINANVECPVKLIVFDYLEYVGNKAATEELRLSRAVGRCHEIASRIDCPFVVLSQLTDDGSERPMLKSIRYSQSVGNKAALVMFVYYPYKRRIQLGYEEPLMEDKNAYELLIRKNTHGPTGDIPMRFYEDTGTFIDPLRESEERIHNIN